MVKSGETAGAQRGGRISLAEASRRAGRILSRGASSELETGAAPTFNDLTEALAVSASFARWLEES